MTTLNTQPTALSEIAPLNFTEWKDANNAAKRDYDKRLGKRPSFSTVKNLVPNRYTITTLEYTAALVLIIVSVFTGFKVGALGVRFAHDLLTAVLGQETYIAPLVEELFTLVTVFMFIAMSTLGLIYFKLLDHDDETIKLKAANQIPWHGWSLKSAYHVTSWIVSFDFWTPRLPILITYMCMGWLFYVSSQGNGSAFEKYLPVFFEIGLAALVGRVLDKRAAYRKVVFDRLEEEDGIWKSRMTNYETDPLYLKLLFGTLRESLIHVIRHRTDGKPYKPNVSLEMADGPSVNKAVLDQYRRYSGGLEFGNMVSAMKLEEAEIAQAQAEKRKPRDGKNWTPQSLLLDLQAQGVTGPLKQGDIDRMYDSTYQARKAWRDGAQHEYERARAG